MDAESVLQVIQAVSLIVAALTAIYGINAWRSEFVGKKRIDLAEEVLVRFYEARDAIGAIRNPFGYVGEGSTRQAGEHESAEEKQIFDKATSSLSAAKTQGSVQSTQSQISFMEVWDLSRALGQAASKRDLYLARCWPTIGGSGR
jgi:hypothetical protein